MPSFPIKYRVSFLNGDWIDVEVDEGAYRLYNKDADDAAASIACEALGHSIGGVKEVEYL